MRQRRLEYEFSQDMVSAIDEMLDRGISYRKIAKEIKERYNVTVPPMRISRYVMRKRPIEKEIELKYPRTPLTINIEDEILDKLRMQVQESKKSNLSKIINDRLSDWFEHTPTEDRANQAFSALKKRSADFKDGRRKFRKSIKRTIHTRKDFLEKLVDVQNEIDEQADAFFVHWVRPDEKATLEDFVNIAKDLGCLETKQHKHKPIVSIAQIINVILGFET